MKTTSLKLILILSFMFSSCSYMDDFFDSPTYEVKNMDKDHLSIVFSGNIHGETHPCGCRKFPLGGLPQVAGFLHEIEKEKSYVYVDAGDTFFPSTFVPERLKDSISFSAYNLAKGLEKLGLDFYVPGDQDFAIGIDFLKDIAKKHSFTFLISNLKDEKTFEGTKPWVKLKKGPHLIFLIGVVEPEVIPTPYQDLFSPVSEALQQAIKEIEEDGFKVDNPFHRLLVVSHSGLERDKELAKTYPFIEWIIGAHSQSFTQKPVTQNKTRLVQVLSQNHYIGEVQISLTSDKKQDRFFIHDMKDSWANKLSPNPLIPFIDQHKEEVAQIQKREQESDIVETKKVRHFETAQSCLECHTPQAQKWMSTAHSMAYQTLIRVNEPYKMNCIECHALGAREPRGFSSVSDMIHINPDKLVEAPNETRQPIQDLDEVDENDKIKQLKESYWNEVREAFSDLGPLREMDPKEREVYSQRWLDIDRVNGLTHNFANVQCLNCHAQHPDHPFHISNEPEPTYEEKADQMKKRCLDCHNKDQSPEWYHQDEKGLAGELNEEVFQAQKKLIACPSMEETQEE